MREARLSRPGYAMQGWPDRPHFDLCHAGPLLRSSHQAVITNPLFYLLALPAVILLGLGKGGFAGLGMVSVPLLTLSVPTLQGAAILLPILITQDAISVWNYRHDWSASKSEGAHSRRRPRHGRRHSIRQLRLQCGNRLAVVQIVDPVLQSLHTMPAKFNVGLSLQWSKTLGPCLSADPITVRVPLIPTPLTSLLSASAYNFESHLPCRNFHRPH